MSSQFRRYLLQSSAWRVFAVAARPVIYAPVSDRLMKIMAAGAGDGVGNA